jgi:hypothetical protein
MHNGSRIVRMVGLLLAVISLFAHQEEARAQSETPSFELYGGYAYLRDQEIETNFSTGWSVSFARNLSRSLGIVGDVGGNYTTLEGVDLSIHAFMGGLRYSFRGETITPYFEGLAGVARAGASYQGVSASDSEFAIQGGAGIYIFAMESVAFRTGVDFRNIFSEGTSTQEFRVLGGVSFGFGSLDGMPPVSRRAEPSGADQQRGMESGTPSYELYGGYAYLREQDLETNFSAGWSVSFAKNLSRSLGIVGDVGGNYTTLEGVDLSVHAFLGGIRYSFRGGAVTPYVEGLAGLARAGASYQDISASDSEFAIQGGAGVSIRFTESVAVRTGVDFRNIFSEDGSSQEFRVIAGLSFGFGSLEGPPPPAPRRMPDTRAPEPPPTRQPPLAPPQQPQPPIEEPPPPEPEPEPVQPPEMVPTAPPAPAEPEPAQTPFGRGQEMMRVGDYAVAADYFREHLRSFASDKYTIAVGLFCDRENVAQIVRSATGSDQLFLIRLSRQGRECYGVYWGLYDSQFDAQQEIGSIPAALRASGQAPMAVERILR